MNFNQLFDTAYEKLKTNEVIPAFRLLGKPLSEIYQAHESNGTAEIVIAAARAHPLFALTQEDPYTHRANTKPRGYAGDAVMMDYIYEGVADKPMSTLGTRIFQATTRVSMGLSVVYRKALLSAYINDTAALADPFRILSIASGHCRELKDTLSLDGAFNGEFIALDADELSCAEVKASYPAEKVKTIHANVKHLLVGKDGLQGQFNLIYSAGLFDYLAPAVASKLVSTLLSKLSPGGRLLVANFLPQSFGRGYMECFMDWRLIYRTEQELIDLFPEELHPQISITVDPHGNVAYARYDKPNN